MKLDQCVTIAGDWVYSASGYVYLGCERRWIRLILGYRVFDLVL